MHRGSSPPSWWSDLPESDDAGPALPVELKVLLSVRSRRVVRDAARRALPGRSVHYFDTPDLDLARRGVVLRLRAVGDDRGDLTVKIRRSDPWCVPKSLRRHRELAVELDTLPGARHWSAELRRPVRRDLLRDVLAGRRPLGDVFTGAQRQLYDVMGGIAPHLARLRPVGPVRIRRLKLATLDCGSRVVAETCRYPDGSRLVEVSVKCPAGQAALAAEEFTALLRDLHVDTARRQRTKTSTALDMLARKAS